MSTLSTKFKKCPNGHYYDASLPSCPYCPKDGSAPNSNEGTQTIGSMNGGTVGYGPEAQAGNMSSGATKTIDVSGGSFGNETTETIGGAATGNIPSGGDLSGRTLVYDDVYTEDGKVETVVRNRRKLVGWLVSYTLDEMGMDFKLYEGRNIIGRNIDCNITIPDETVSGNHATILYRDGKYSIKDNQSTKGTFVNEKDIDLDAVRLNDGDVIKLGRTILKFRSAF